MSRIRAFTIWASLSATGCFGATGNTRSTVSIESIPTALPWQGNHFRLVSADDRRFFTRLNEAFSQSSKRCTRVGGIVGDGPPVILKCNFGVHPKTEPQALYGDSITIGRDGSIGYIYKCEGTRSEFPTIQKGPLGWLSPGEHIIDAAIISFDGESMLALRISSYYLKLQLYYPGLLNTSW